MKRAIWLLMAVGWLTAVPAFSQQAQTEKPGAITERIAAQNREQKAQLAAPSVLTNKDVLEMLKVGLPAEVVVAKIRSSTCNFDTSPATLAKLKADGAPDSVILAMVQVSAAPQEPRSVEAAKTGQRVQQYESSDTTACKVYFSVVLLDDRVPGGIAWGMDERQRRWYQTEGRKKYPVVCYVLDPQDARVSYVVAWSTEHEVTRPTGIFVDVSPGGRRRVRRRYDGGLRENPEPDPSTTRHGLRFGLARQDRRLWTPRSGRVRCGVQFRAPCRERTALARHDSSDSEGARGRGQVSRNSRL